MNAYSRSTLSRLARAGTALLACAAAAGMNAANCQGGNCPNHVGTGLQPTVVDEDHAMGDADAAVTVIEYGDFQCPACGFFARETFPDIKETYIDTGLVRWIFRHFPLPQHDRADAAAQAAECAANQADFFLYHDALFATQDLSEAALQEYASDLGIDVDVFSLCLQSGEEAAGVQQDYDSGTDLGVPGTPSFLVNGRLVCSTDLVSFIEEELNGG